MAVSIIKDPVTGQSYSRDDSVAGSTYAAYTPPAVASATPATAYKNVNLGAYDGTPDKVLDSSLATATANMAAPDEKKIYKTKLSQYQAEIDATNQIYAQKLAETQQTGLGNLGSARATQVRSGLLGSDFAGAQNDKVTQANTDAENLVTEEQSAKINAILGLARSDAADEIAAKRAAQASSTQDYISFLGAKSDRQSANAKKVAQSLLDQDIDTSRVDPTQLAAIAKTYGIATSDITTQYAALKKAKDDAARTQSASDAKDGLTYDPKTNTYTRQADPVSVGEGDALIDPTTGKQIYYNPKTYAPSQGTDPNALLSITESAALGLPYGTTVAEAIAAGVTPAGKAPTNDQSLAAGYATRAANANNTIGGLATYAQTSNPALYQAGTSAEKGAIGNFIVGKTAPQLQQLSQAQRNFATAVLRRESGAAISTGEFDTLYQQYFPRPGDTAATLALKAQNREDAISSLNEAAGPARPKTSTSTGTTGKTSSGVSYTVTP